MRPLYTALACPALYFGLISAVCLLSAHALELTISGSSTGQGTLNLSFAGDLINVSILQNSSWQGWNVTLGAHAA